ncbi:MAG: diguanylate cyclase [Alphaproteobacteria bacterium]|nr:diguanylate cyclase [Alphaproteobacteria bacterium]
MKILVIDRDALHMQLVSSRLSAQGHRVVEETVKNNALERLEKESFDLILFDPAPLNNARPLALSIRRTVPEYPYIVLMSHDMDEEETIRSGANALLPKPMDSEKLEEITRNADYLTRLVQRLGDETEDFPSAGGVIAKSAFNQLFLSALDRADRYGEESFMVFIGIKNYQEILDHDGAQSAKYAAAKLSQYLVRLRRQSDIIAQVGDGEFCLLLQRPVYETEPMEAVSRFAEAMKKLEDMGTGGAGSDITLSVSLVEIPSGSVMADYLVTHENRRAG